MKRIVIIGNGISGITAARNIRKRSDYEITVVSAESDYFFSRTALMYIYMGHMKYEHTKPYEDDFWTKNQISLIRDYVNEINAAKKELHLAKGPTLEYDTLIIASGSKANKLNLSGENAFGVQSLISLQDLDLLEENTRSAKAAVIVGGGLIGIEMAEMLLSRNIAVTMLIREPEFWSNVLPIEEAAMVSDHIVEHHIELKKKTQVAEIVTDDGNKLTGVVTSDGEKINCQILGITIGVSPNINFLKNSSIATDKGVLVNNFFETNVEDVYAIGDCAQFTDAPAGRKAIEQVWYTGRMHGETVAHSICGNRTAYKPGVWFNSAKFLNIEYQTYGNIAPQLSDTEAQFFWQHEDNKKALRIVFDKRQKNVLGFNILGMRYRHAICDDWIKHKATIKEVLTNLKDANFDPEFFTRFENDILASYNQHHPNESIALKSRKKILGLF